MKTAKLDATLTVTVKEHIADGRADAALDAAAEVLAALAPDPILTDALSLADTILTRQAQQGARRAMLRGARASLAAQLANIDEALQGVA